VLKLTGLDQDQLQKIIRPYQRADDRSGLLGERGKKRVNIFKKMSCDYTYLVLQMGLRNTKSGVKSHTKKAKKRTLEEKYIFKLF
jgi:hypothetical protein